MATRSRLTMTDATLQAMIRRVVPRYGELSARGARLMPLALAE
jgi:hypothetical protein